MEAGTNAISRTPQTDGEQGPGGANRRQSSWSVAHRKLARPDHRFTKCLLCKARASAHGRAVLAQSAEPPYADPHVRWCGRGGGATRPPMPILDLPSAYRRGPGPDGAPELRGADAGAELMGRELPPMECGDDVERVPAPERLAALAGLGFCPWLIPPRLGADIATGAGCVRWVTSPRCCTCCETL